MFRFLVRSWKPLQEGRHRWACLLSCGHYARTNQPKVPTWLECKKCQKGGA